MSIEIPNHKKKHILDTSIHINFKKYKTQSLDVNEIYIDDEYKVVNDIKSYVKNKYSNISKMIKYKLQESFMYGKDKGFKLDDEFGSEYWNKYKEVEQTRVLEAMKRKPVPNTNIMCHNCKKRMIIYTEVQKKRADEASTTIYKCLYCGNGWTKS